MISPRSISLTILLPIFLLLYSASIFADIKLEISKLVSKLDNSLTRSEKKLEQKAHLLSDSIGRVKVTIRAACGTDPRQVEEILVNFAREHPMVITHNPVIDQPRVLFKEFGDIADLNPIS
jgi:hypothetical protein